MGSGGGGLVGWDVASDVRRRRFESGHQQNLIMNSFTLIIEKTKKEETGNGPFLK